MNKYDVISICLICLLLFSVADALAYNHLRDQEEDVEFDEESLEKSEEEEDILGSSIVIENPDPSDGQEGLNSTPKLSVLVSHPEGQEMDVSFYENDTEDLIDGAENVTSGERAEVVWDNLLPEENHSWYVVADDGQNTTEGGPWNFTTAGIDYVEITDEVNGTALSDKDVPPNYEEWGYLSTYNDTYGFFDNPQGKWSVSAGTNASLLWAEIGSHNGINVGDEAGNVWFNVTLEAYDYDYNYSIKYTVITDEDYVEITDSPGGDPLENETVEVGHRVRGYCSVYNETVGYLYTVEGNWSTEGGDSYLLEDSYNESNVIDVGHESGPVWFNLSYEGFNDSVEFLVEPGDAAEFRFDTIEDQVAGEPFEITITAYDEYDNVATGYEGTAVLTDTTETIDPDTIEFTEGTATVSVIITDSQEGVTIEAEDDEITGTSNEFTVEPGDAAEFRFDTIEDQVAGEPFEITITAYDEEDNRDTDYEGTADLTDSTGTISPGEVTFTDGTWTGDVTITESQEEVTIEAEDGEITGTSNEFTVEDPKIDYIRIISDPDDPNSTIDSLTLDAGEECEGYSAGFNDTTGFVELVETSWMVNNHEGAAASTSPSQGNSSVFDAGPYGGEAEWISEYGGDTSYTVEIDILPPNIDEIFIRSESGGEGEILDYIELEMEEEISLYPAGYNDTFGYQKDVEADWSLDDEEVGELTESQGDMTTFIPSEPGDVEVTALYEGIEATVEIKVLDDHFPEIVGDIPDLDLERNFGMHEIDLTEHASDEHDDLSELKWYLTGVNSSVISIYGENQTGNHVITLLSEEDALGRMDVRYWLVNSAGNTVSQGAWINVTTEYESPSIRRCPDLYVHYDEPYEFDYSPYIIYDEKRFDELVLETDDPEHTSVSGLKVTYEYPEDMLGDEVLVTITVSDEKESVSTVISVFVTSNSPPEEIEELPDITIEQGELKENVFDLDDYFMDPDDEPLYMSYGYTYLTITIHDNHTVDIRAAENWHGVERVTFRAQDPVGAIVEQTINVTVIPVNHPPEIKDLPPFVIHYDEPYEFDLEFYIHDPDNETHELTITTCTPEYVEVEGTKLIMDYPETMNGLEPNYTVPLNVSVSDGIDADYEVTTVTVGSYYPPELVVPLHDVSFKENEKLLNAFNLDNHFMNREDDTMYYSSGNEHIEVVIHENSSVDFYAPENWNGQELITIRATNMGGALMEDSLTVTVIPVNNPPEIADIPRQEGEVGRSWILDMRDYISDVDNETHELDVMVDDPNVEVFGQKLLFEYDEPGEFNVTVEICDGLDNTTGIIEVYIEETDPWYSNNLLFLLGLTPIGLIGIVLYVKRVEYTIEDIFLIHDSGRLIKHIARTVKEERDEDILAGMFTAVQNFVDDAFAEEDDEVLKRMEYGDKKVLVHKGDSIILAVFISGDEPKWALEGMKNLVSDIEERYGEDIKNWSGDVKEVSGIKQMLEALHERRGKYKSGDWEKYSED